MEQVKQKLQIRATADLVRDAKIIAARRGISLQKYALGALQDAVRRDTEKEKEE